MAKLREWFGPSKNMIWAKISEELGAELIETDFRSDVRIEATHREWTIALISTNPSGTRSHITTQLLAPYVNADQFRFTIYREELFGKLAKLIGMQDIKVGHDEFDRKFIIEGSDEKKVRLLFNNEKIRQLILAEPDIFLSIKDDEGWLGPVYPKNADVLYFEMPDLIQDIERLKRLFELFSEVLDQLCAIGSAYKDAPKLDHC